MRRFNPRAREGRDPDLAKGEPGKRKVSIHAPVRGATPPRSEDWGVFHVSIHAPVRGATGKRLVHKIALLGFNPRAREGRDTS